MTLVRHFSEDQDPRWSYRMSSTTFINPNFGIHQNDVGDFSNLRVLKGKAIPD